MIKPIAPISIGTKTSPFIPGNRNKGAFNLEFHLNVLTLGFIGRFKHRLLFKLEVSGN